MCFRKKLIFINLIELNFIELKFVTFYRIIHFQLFNFKQVKLYRKNNTREIRFHDEYNLSFHIIHFIVQFVTRKSKIEHTVVVYKYDSE